jgi:hypothetical protein
VRTETDPRLVKLKEKVCFWKQMYTETKDELDSFLTQKVPTLKQGELAACTYNKYVYSFLQISL